MRRSVTIAACFVVLLISAPASAQDAESRLDPWSLAGHIMIDESPGNVVEYRGYECDEIQEVIGQYNDVYIGASDSPEGWPTFISIYRTSLADYHVLQSFSEANDLAFPWPYGEVHFCTTVHEDGWLPAVADRLDADNPYVTVTIIGPVACSAGQLLMIQSGYYYANGRWNSFLGIGWVEEYNGGPPTVSGTFNMECMEIVPGGAADFADVAELVPSTQDNLNPTVTGLTGLATWLWYDFTQPASHLLQTQVAVPARGTVWNLDMVAWVDEVWWDIDCVTECDYHGPRAAFDETAIDYVLDLPDSAEVQAPVYNGGLESDEDAAAQHLYRTKGDYIVSTSTVWRGVYTFAGITYYYDPVVVATARPYQVVEVRSIITNP